jgi:hypothetical protein
MGQIDPVFIVGGARSGTTFLAKLLDSHPDVLYRHEPDSVRVNTEIPFVPRPEEIGSYIASGRDYLDVLSQVGSTKTSGQRPFFNKSYRTTLQKQAFLGGLYIAKALERFARPVVRPPLRVPDWIGSDGTTRIMPLIKSVDSPWRTLLFSKAQPTFRFIHIVRHPCGVVNSRMRGIQQNLMSEITYLRPPFEAGMAEGYSRTLNELEAASYEERAAFLWMLCNQRIHDDMADNDRYRMVSYDDICRNLEPETRRLFEFAGLDWHTQTERFIHDLQVQGSSEAGYFNVMRSPLTAVDKWRQQLTRDQIARIEDVVRESEVGRRFVDTPSDHRERLP